MKFDVLHNFISPVTGRILADEDYVLVGDSNGIATPSPILIDIRLDIIEIRKNYESFLKDYQSLVTADLIVGHSNDQIPNAQVLSKLEDGYVFNTQGTLSTRDQIQPEDLYLPEGQLFIGNDENVATPSQTIALSNLPGLTAGYIWRGDSNNRPDESPDLTNLEDSVTFTKTVTIPSIQVDVAKINVTLYYGIPPVPGLVEVVAGLVIAVPAAAALAGIAFSTASGAASNANRANSRIDNLKLNNIPINGNVSFSDGNTNYRLINLADPIDDHDGVNLETLKKYVNDNSTNNITGFVVGGPSVNGTINTVRGFTDLDMLGYRVENIQQSPTGNLDAISAQFLWDLMHDEVEAIWL